MAQDRTEDVRSKLQQLQVADNPTQEPVDKNDMGVVVAPVNPRQSQRLIENGIKRHGIPNQREREELARHKLRKRKREELARKRMARLDLHRRVQPSTVRVTKVKNTTNGYDIRIGSRTEYMTTVQSYSSRREKLTVKWNNSWVFSELDKIFRDKRRAEEKAEERNDSLEPESMDLF